LTIRLNASFHQDFEDRFMKKLIALFAVTIGLFSVPGSAQAIDPYFGFNYGFALGPSWTFRNRLPTPPYFSIYSPVYYGQQYERPYGISPFAAFPEMNTPPSYQAQPRATVRSVVVPNDCLDENCGSDQSVSIDEAPLAAAGKSIWVENPYITNESAIAAK
jgi:hypothetical protein